MRVADFDYALPAELIAQVPAAKRDASRLLVLRRSSQTIEHRTFWDLPEYLHAGDVLVLNNSKVIAARLRGKNARTEGRFEILLLEEVETNSWWAMLRPGKRARPGTVIEVLTRQEQASGINAAVIDTNPEGHRLLRFEGTPQILEVLDALGEVPLPPYISRPAGNRDELDRQRYQTVYAQPAGSVAAPTAGLHFTNSLLESIRARGVQTCTVTLHVGLGTFAPVKADAVEDHPMHAERFELTESAAQLLNTAKFEGRRVIAVGTTSVRVLETVANQHAGSMRAGRGKTDIFIFPPYRFKITDGLVTNFHLPRSTLLMLVSAFAAPGDTAGRQLALNAYAEAIRERYHFFSYGDAMFLVD